MTWRVGILPPASADPEPRSNLLPGSSGTRLERRKRSPTPACMLIKLSILALCGALGTLARYGLSVWVERANPFEFPLGTLAVNLLGCFVFGLLWAIAESRTAGASELRLFALIGFCGAFTTFSTLAFDGSLMLTRAQWSLLALNVGLSNVLGIGMVLLGLALGRGL